MADIEPPKPKTNSGRKRGDRHFTLAEKAKLAARHSLRKQQKKIIKAKSKKLYKNNNELALLVGNVEIDFYNDRGEHISMLYADSARINEQSNDLKANGNVYVVSDSGYTLSTQQIIWDNSYKVILAEDSIMFTTTEGDTLYGVGFESDSDLEEWRIFRPFGISREGI